MKIRILTISKAFYILPALRLSWQGRPSYGADSNFNVYAPVWDITFAWLVWNVRLVIKGPLHESR